MVGAWARVDVLIVNGHRLVQDLGFSPHGIDRSLALEVPFVVVAVGRRSLANFFIDVAIVLDFFSAFPQRVPPLPLLVFFEARFQVVLGGGWRYGEVLGEIGFLAVANAGSGTLPPDFFSVVGGMWASR